MRYESAKEWGGFSVHATKLGWLVSQWGRLQRTRTGGRWLVYYSPRFPMGLDLTTKTGRWGGWEDQASALYDLVMDGDLGGDFGGEKVRRLAKTSRVA